ncbi:unnamed protein product [Lupinus luteus]|uniref:Magnesium transporter n=1 Tax=Lupinus luteus TaxID=3873 RepID=A0AAV1WL90_LUPLU
MKFSEEPKVNRPGAGTGVGIRKKGVTGVRSWLLLDSTGDTHVIQAGKHAIMRRTGLPARDLRILDPLLSYPSTILGRERAIVINLEHIKAIITANEVLLLNSKDPSVTPFVDELHSRIVRYHSHASKTPNHDSKEDQENGIKILPFEFVALEACLEAACGVLDNELRDYVDDTENYINIMLDDKQNHLLQMGVILSTATVVVNAFTVVADVLGINIHIPLFDDGGIKEFLWTICGSTAGAIFFFMLAILWFKHKGLLE